MRCIQTILFLFCLHFITLIETGVVKDRLTELEDAVKKNKITSSSSNQRSSFVFIGNNMSYEIYVYEPKGVKYFNKFFDDTLAKFYICINCIFAEWIYDQLIKLIAPIPLLHQKLFLYKYNDQFLKRFKKSQALVNEVMEISEKIINVLMAFLNIYLSANDTSNDTLILRTLLSLNFKMHFITKHSTEVNTNKKKDSALIRMMLGVLNSIQNFIILNCSLSSYLGNIQFADHSENKSKEDNMVKIFRKIKHLNLESQKQCNIKQMLLVDVIPCTFGRIKWKIQNGFVTVEHIMQKIQQWYDLEIIQWYQTFILNTITKLLITKALNHYKQRKNFSKVIVNEFETIYSSVISGHDSISTKTIECFSLLIKKKKMSFVQKFTSSFMAYVREDNSYPIDYDPEEHMTACLNFFDDIELEEDSNSIPTSEGFDNVSEQLNNLPISTLEEFIVYLKKIIDDFTCFIRLFEFLHNENNTYNVPSVQKMEKIKLFEQDLLKNVIGTDEPTKDFSHEEIKKEDQEILNCEGCYYFKGLFHYCLDTIIHLNMTNEANQDKRIKEDYNFQANNNLKIVKEFSLTLLNNYWYLPHLKVVYNIIPLVELLIEFNFSVEYNDKNRLLLVIMNELNNYDIEFCNPPLFNFLFLNNINFNMIGLLSTQVKNEIETSMKALKSHAKVSDHVYSRIHDIFKNFFDSYSALHEYSNITLMWKGKKQTIGDIYNSFVYAILSPPNLYATFNFFFKFSLAILFYEMHNAYIVINNSSALANKHKFSINLKENQFPTIFKEIIININHFDNYYTNKKKLLKERESIKIKLHDQFEKIGIYIDFTNSIKDNIAHLNVKGIINFINDVIRNFERNCVYGQISS